MGASIACLMGMASQSTRVALVGFRKIACEKAARPGFICDYRAALSTNNADLQALVGRLPNGIATARFVFSDGAWLLIE